MVTTFAASHLYCKFNAFFHINVWKGNYIFINIYLDLLFCINLLLKEKSRRTTFKRSIARKSYSLCTQTPHISLPFYCGLKSPLFVWYDAHI